MGSDFAGNRQRGAPGDALAVANASLQATAQATQTTLDLGRQFLGGLGINLGGGPAAGAANTSPSRIPRANGRQAIEYVIRRPDHRWESPIPGAAALWRVRVRAWTPAPGPSASTARG
ncbi:putative cell wall-associated hydrolase, invasion-associated protein [Mycobacterium kansasii]|uniref:Putative cell wall-associated hydrolase, invasion-associated protein n=1 Tax=Mycobacterium kansasii TaxID=1768 RepID=A0A1V3WI95_MYCKA|nr:putative cell wall-associated hydrolase, invasion-associated protein [Mycobacterium kansasii]